VQMTNMKLSIEEKKDMDAPTLVADRPAYPYGLRINLEPEAVKKLGMKDVPSVGEKMMMLAMVEVVRIEQEKHMDDTPEYTVSLQITDMELSKGKPSGDDRDASEVLYGSKES